MRFTIGACSTGIRTYISSTFRPQKQCKPSGPLYELLPSTSTICSIHLGSYTIRQFPVLSSELPSQLHPSLLDRFITIMVDWQVATKAVVSTCLAWLVYTLVKGVYNLYFHPLSRFPGPKAAAFSSLWKVYIEVVKRESLVEKLFDYHAVYGAFRFCALQILFLTSSGHRKYRSNRTK